MKAKIFLQVLLQGVLLFNSLGWEVKMPRKIHGLKGSCLVIPCSFSYTSNPPKNPNRIVWYMWDSFRYPLVYDPKNPSQVVDLFRRKTDLYKLSSNDCSLLIRKLEQSHSEKQLYVWIDPENVKSSVFQFYNFTSEIHVEASPQPPSISTSGGDRIGGSITVNCSTSHSCLYSKPVIDLKGIEGSDKTINKCYEDGQCLTTLTRTGIIKAEESDLVCTVTHYGNIKVNAKQQKKALCTHNNITIEPERADFSVGVPQNFTCTIHYSCQNEHPIITWNNKKMNTSKGSKTNVGLERISYSSLYFLGTAEHHGTQLTCISTLLGSEVSASVVLHQQASFHYDSKSIGLYILAPTLGFTLTCILVGVFLCKRRQRSPEPSAASVNMPFSKPYLPSPKSHSKVQSTNDYENEHIKVEELAIYGNI